jgi:hypothetical protein
VDSRYSLSNLVLLLLFPLSYTPNTFHISYFISQSFLSTPFSVANPRFIRLILLYVPLPTNLVGVPALAYWYHHLCLDASPTYIVPVPRCYSTCECRCAVTMLTRVR